MGKATAPMIDVPNCQVPAPAQQLPLTQTQTIEDLAAELRELIVEECFETSQPVYHHRNKVPNFIIALRPCPKSYHQALRMMYAKHAFYLYEYNKWSLNGMSCNALSMITKLDIKLTSLYGVAPGSRAWRPGALTSGVFSAAIQYAPNIRKVTLYYDLNLCGLDTMTDFLWRFPRWLNAFKELASVSVAIPLYPFHLDTDIVKDKKISRVLNYVDRQVGVVARFQHMDETPISEWGSSDDATRAEVWAWETAKGITMDWSDVSARKWDTWVFWDVDEALGFGEEGFVVI